MKTSGTMHIRIEARGGVKILHLSSGPANILSVTNGMASALASAIAESQKEVGCIGIVIAGSDNIFCGGADLGDLDRADELRGLFERIERSATPVVMAIQGEALGGGLELALAGHCRIASPYASFALPEIALGLLPGLGGTQRLPRLVGTGCALDLMITGKKITADEALAAGLIDGIVGDDIVDEAVRMLQEGRVRLRRTSRMPLPDDPADVIAAHRRSSPHGISLAAAKILDCVAAVSGNFSEGMALERRSLNDLVASDASKALRHAFFAQRMAMRIPGIDKHSSVGPPASARVYGKCASARQTAERLSKSGIKVSIDGSQPIASSAELLVLMEKADPEFNPEMFASNALVAYPRHLAKTFDQTRVSFAGRSMEFHCPVNSPLMELIRADDTLPSAMASMAALGKAMGKVVVISGHEKGSVYERLVQAYIEPVFSLLADGTPPERIDLALERWGMTVGPCAMAQDYGSFSDGFIASQPRSIPLSEEQIVERCLLALINEGAHILDSGIAWRSTDIDVIAVSGLGFPRTRGGPMFQADIIGLPTVVRKLDALQAEHPMCQFTAAPMIRKLATGRHGFADRQLAA